MLFQSYTIHCTHLCKILEKRKKKKKQCTAAFVQRSAAKDVSDRDFQRDRVGSVPRQARLL